MKSIGQSTIEFTFTLVAMVFLTYGLIQIFRWTGMDLAERRWAHEQSLMNSSAATVEQQLSPDFYRPKRMNTYLRKWQ